MKERPILFSGPMVRAILEGRKTQTRRVVKCNPHKMAYIGIDLKDMKPTWAAWNEKQWNEGGSQTAKCPYGQPGDRLWVRETFSAGIDNGEHSVLYKADSVTGGGSEMVFAKWKPSIHMPRWASRILLEIVSVRVERLRCISPEDVVAEGIKDSWQNGALAEYYQCQRGDILKADFAKLWKSINGPVSWEMDPWVWVVEFKMLDTVK